MKKYDLPLGLAAGAAFMVALYAVIAPTRDGERLPAVPPSAVPAMPSASVASSAAPPVPSQSPTAAGREIDPAWEMPHPVLSPLETRAAQAVEAVALRDGFAVRSVTCKPRRGWQICDLCYSHPLRYYGQIRVACNERACEPVHGNDDPRMADVDLSFCETH